MVKDLGSTNGTFIERSLIQEGSLAPGQRLQLGSVEFVLDGSPKAPAIPVVLAHSPSAASPALAPSVRLAHSSPPETTQPAVRVAPTPPSHSGPPKPSFQADRNSAEQQARSKMLWGDPPEDVTKYLMMQGFGVEEASGLTAVLLQDRVKMLRGIDVASASPPVAEAQ